jgi:phosphoribulokinase
MDIMAQHLLLLRRGEAILKPVYRHADGSFGPPVYLRPGRFLIVEGLLGYHTDTLRDCFDIRVFLDPPESLRRRWKVVRDCSRRGYTTNEVLDELDRREPDSDQYIRPQRQHADMVVRFSPPAGCDNDSDATHLDAHLLLRPGLPHPDLSDVVGDDERGLSLVGTNDEQDLRVPGLLEPATALELEERIWEHMHFASHLRSERLGEFTIGTDLHRSDSLAIVQLLVLYHLVTARAKIALGGAEAATRI